MSRTTNRRDFLAQATLASLAAPAILGSPASVLARSVRGTSAADKVRIACIGVGGKGDSDTNDAGKHGEIVALCDIDDNTLDKMAAKYPDAKKYNDFRKMLDEMGAKIDAVTVSTPDHTHAPASVMAMRMGKHCFTQKPMAWSVEEARVMRELAAEKGLCTQMGNQGTAENGFRQGVGHDQVGHARADQGDPRLDQPPHLAAGHRPAQGDGRGPQAHPLGRVHLGRPHAPLCEGLSPVRLARLARLRHRRSRRHGLPHDQRRRHGSGVVRPVERRGRGHLGHRRSRDVSRSGRSSSTSSPSETAALRCR